MIDGNASLKPGWLPEEARRASKQLAIITAILHPGVSEDLLDNVSRIESVTAENAMLKRRLDLVWRISRSAIVSAREGGWVLWRDALQKLEKIEQLSK